MFQEERRERDITPSQIGPRVPSGLILQDITLHNYFFLLLFRSFIIFFIWRYAYISIPCNSNMSDSTRGNAIKHQKNDFWKEVAEWHLATLIKILTLSKSNFFDKTFNFVLSQLLFFHVTFHMIHMIDIYIRFSRNRQLGGLVLVSWLGVPPRYKAGYKGCPFLITSSVQKAFLFILLVQ